MKHGLLGLLLASALAFPSWAEEPIVSVKKAAFHLFTFQFPTARPPTRSGMKHLLDCHRVVGTEVGFSLVRCSPFSSSTRGSPEHPRLSPRVVIGPGARLLEFSLLGPHAGGVLGASDASLISPLLRP
jgi:hypothetical protein